MEGFEASAPAASYDWSSEQFLSEDLYISDRVRNTKPPYRYNYYFLSYYISIPGNNYINMIFLIKNL